MQKILQIVAIFHDKMSGNCVQLTGPKIVAVQRPHLLYDRTVQRGTPVKLRIENSGNDPMEV